MVRKSFFANFVSANSFKTQLFSIKSPVLTTKTSLSKLSVSMKNTVKSNFCTGLLNLSMMNYLAFLRVSTANVTGTDFKRVYLRFLLKLRNKISIVARHKMFHFLHPKKNTYYAKEKMLKITEAKLKMLEYLRIFFLKNKYSKPVFYLTDLSYLFNSIVIKLGITDPYVIKTLRSSILYKKLQFTFNKARKILSRRKQIFRQKVSFSIINKIYKDLKLESFTNASFLTKNKIFSLISRNHSPLLFCSRYVLKRHSQLYNNDSILRVLYVRKILSLFKHILILNSTETERKEKYIVNGRLNPFINNVVTNYKYFSILPVSFSNKTFTTKGLHISQLGCNSNNDLSEKSLKDAKTEDLNAKIVNLNSLRKFFQTALGVLNFLSFRLPNSNNFLNYYLNTSYRKRRPGSLFFRPTAHSAELIV